MTLAHPLLGIVLGNHFGHFWFIFLGSVFPDLDHLAVIFKDRISLKKILKCFWLFERSFWPFKKYNTKYKSKYVHSILGAVVASGLASLFDFSGGLYFFIAYIIHLMIDMFCVEENQYFYPFKKKIKGFLFTPSKTEIVFTLLLVVLVMAGFKDYPAVVGIWGVFIVVLTTLSFKFKLKLLPRK